MMQCGMKPGLSSERLARASHRTPRPRAWLAVIVALLLALTWQNFLVQTHWHAPAPQALSASHGGEAGDSGQKAPSDQQPACLTCLALANATPALPTASPVIAGVPPVTFFVTASVAAPLSVQAPASPWRSRAPPISLPV